MQTTVNTLANGSDKAMGVTNHFPFNATSILYQSLVA
jgi:hypothetical protein